MAFQNLVHRLRQFRTWHHWVGISVVLFMLITSITGVLLGWKKNVEVLQPATLKGRTTNLNEWVSFDKVSTAASYAIDSVLGRAIEIDRMDVRPDKGIIKVTFKEGYWEVQVDGANGKILSVAQRHADWIEHIHDGSVISDGFKLIYTNYIGLGLLTLSVTGFWLWYGPRRIRKVKRGN
jgi:uncharacterized iron-regulated membrane protein